MHFEDDRVTKLVGDKNDPVYRGYSCIKGRNFHEWHASDTRVLHPLSRDSNGDLEKVSLDGALNGVADKLKRIIREHGPRSVAMYSGTFSHFCVAGVMTRLAFMDAIGSPMRFSNATIDQPGKPIAMALHGRWAAGPQPFDEAEVCLLVGANPLVSMWGGIPAFNPARRLHRARTRGLKLIVIDPRRTESAQKAHMHLQCLPGFDSQIVAAMIHVVIREQLFDAEFVRQETRGLDALSRHVAPFTPEVVGRLAGLDPSQIESAARTFAAARSGNATGGTGSNMAPNGTLLEYLLLCLNTICGRWVKAGEQVSNLGVLFRMYSPHARAQKPRPAFGFGEKLRVRGLSDTAAGLPTAALADEILTPGEGQVKALFVVGGNPLTAFPNREKVRRALESLDLLVVVDPQFSASAQLAHYVFGPKFGFELPAISFANEGMVTYGLSIGYQEPYAHYQPPLIDPPEGSAVIEDWRVFYELARRMGLEMGYRGTPYDMQNAPTTDELIEAFVRHSPVPLDDIKASRGGRIFEERSVPAEPREPDWPHRLDVGNGDMMAELKRIAGELQDAYEVTDESARRLLLVSRREHEVYNSVGHSLPALKKRRPYNPVYLHPAEAESLSVGDGDFVVIRSDSGVATGCVHIADDVRRGVISVAHGFPNQDAPWPTSFLGTSVSALIDDAVGYDRFSGLPRMSAIPVAVERE